MNDQLHALAALPPGKEPLWSGRCREDRNLALPENRTGTIQPVASRYTDWAKLINTQNCRVSGRWTKSRNSVTVSVVHHRQNPSDSTYQYCSYVYGTLINWTRFFRWMLDLYPGWPLRWRARHLVVQLCLRICLVMRVKSHDTVVKDVNMCSLEGPRLNVCWIYL
jgi:hypothetical protein